VAEQRDRTAPQRLPGRGFGGRRRPGEKGEGQSLARGRQDAAAGRVCHGPHLGCIEPLGSPIHQPPVSVHDPRDASWRVWRLPGEGPCAYSVWVDLSDEVRLTDFPSNAIVRFDPATESFLGFPSGTPNANVRQMNGVAGAAWPGESGTDRIVRIEYGL
jgi:hypothetical protein